LTLFKKKALRLPFLFVIGDMRLSVSYNIEGIIEILLWPVSGGPGIVGRGEM